MTILLDLRADTSGGFVAKSVTIRDPASPDGLLTEAQFIKRAAGRHVVLVTHGFNVNARVGSESLTIWDELCALAPSLLFVGMLWPGDSRYLPVLDYPLEGSVAVEAGDLLGDFIGRQMDTVGNISFVSHSLGARTVLQAIRATRPLSRRFQQLILMAGAIEQHCLSAEYRDAAARVARVCTVASLDDWVLKFAFPVGNLFGQWLWGDSPYLSMALGRMGPVQATGLDDFEHWQTGYTWDYGHGDYMPERRPAQRVKRPVAMPLPDDAHQPGAGRGWKPDWSAALIARRLGKS